MSNISVSFPNDKIEFFDEFIFVRQFVSDNFKLVKEQGFFDEISQDDLNEAIELITIEYKKYLEKASSINEYFYSDAVKCSIGRFLDSEMDYTTSGIRGMGRISTFIPRFGGLYSKILQGLSNDDLNTIKNTIFCIIKLGYKTAVFVEVLLEREPMKLDHFDTLPFFNNWIPKIYATDWSNSSELSSFIIQSKTDSILYFCLKIADDTNFPQKILALRSVRESQLALIIGKYVEAGFLLRFLETKLLK